MDRTDHGQIHKHRSRLDNLVPEELKERQFPCSVATHACSVKHGVLLGIVERMELDEFDTEALEHSMSQDEAEWMERSHAEMMSLLTTGEAQPVGAEPRRQERLRGVDSALRQVSTRRRRRVSPQHGERFSSLRRSRTFERRERSLTRERARSWS